MLALKTLASRHRWVEMEDYVTNYPANIKQDILSSYRKQFFFYLSALLPQLELARFFSANNFAVRQFQPEELSSQSFKAILITRLMTSVGPKRFISFSNSPLRINLLLALNCAAYHHLSQQLNATHYLMTVKAVLLNQILIIFETIPSYQGAGYSHWEAFITAFENFLENNNPF